RESERRISCRGRRLAETTDRRRRRGSNREREREGGIVARIYGHHRSGSGLRQKRGGHIRGHLGNADKVGGQDASVPLNEAQRQEPASINRQAERRTSRRGGDLAEAGDDRSHGIDGEGYGVRNQRRAIRYLVDH